MAEEKKDGRSNNGKRLGSKNKLQGEIAPKKDRFGSVLAKTSNYQSQTLELFLKRRQGESFEQWNKRTESRRIHGVNKKTHLKIAQKGKVVVKPQVLKGMKRELQLTVVNRFIERPYDYLENYAFVMRWASVRYGISKDDIEIAFFFYNKGMFTKDEFNRVCVQLGTVRGVWSRFVKKPYITKSILVMEDKMVREFEYYQLTSEFLRLLNAIYGALSKVNKLTLTARTSADYKRVVVSPELNEFLTQLNREVDEVNLGIEKPISKK
jgi:hypothetical protein